MYREHLKRNKQNKMNYARGITLVALVITIVILIILATVTVNVAFGDGGLIDQAKLAAEKTANSIYDEEASMANLTAYLAENTGGIVPPEEPEEPEEPEPPVISSFIETEVTANSITVSVEVSDNTGGTLKYEYKILSDKEGYITKIDTEQIGKISCLLGAGRIKKDDVIDYNAGIILNKKINDYVLKGDLLATLYTNKNIDLTDTYLKAITISENKIDFKLILEVIKCSN